MTSDPYDNRQDSGNFISCTAHDCVDNDDGQCIIPGMTQQYCYDHKMFPVSVKDRFCWEYETRRLEQEAKRKQKKE